jgi:outer membrane lipoprotein SlyB
MRGWKRMGVVLAVLAASLLQGCASSNSGSVYSRGEARREMSVRMGVVEGVRSVMIEGTKTPVGTIGGAAVGGIAGSTVGGGRGSAVGAIVGAIVGGVAGSAVEEGVTRKQGLEITVKLDNGEMRAIVQEGDEQFRPGERVRLVSQGGVTRVTH